MAVKFQDYYVTLGVDRTASADDIKQSFRKLARLYHPDVAKNKVTGEAKFKDQNSNGPQSVLRFPQPLGLRAARDAVTQGG